MSPISLRFRAEKHECAATDALVAAGAAAGAGGGVLLALLGAGHAQRAALEAARGLAGIWFRGVVRALAREAAARGRAHEQGGGGHALEAPHFRAGARHGLLERDLRAIDCRGGGLAPSWDTYLRRMWKWREVGKQRDFEGNRGYFMDGLNGRRSLYWR